MHRYFQFIVESIDQRPWAHPLLMICFSNRGSACTTHKPCSRVQLFFLNLFSDLGVSKKGVPQNGWFIMENPIKMDDLWGPPLFLETPICCLSQLNLGPRTQLPTAESETLQDRPGPAKGNWEWPDKCGTRERLRGWKPNMVSTVYVEKYRWTAMA